MVVYLVRHGKAAQQGYANDADRPLTDVGREDITRIAARMAGAGVEVNQIRHSGLVRARETAAILAEYLEPPDGIAAVSGLLSSDPVESWARELHLEPEPVMLVGHNPFMEYLAAAMLSGDLGRLPVRFATSTTACLEYLDGGWVVRWVLDRKITR